MIRNRQIQVAVLGTDEGSHPLVQILRDPGDSSVPAVMIIAPVAMRHRLAREALLAGKHVFVEAPLSLEAAQTEELVALAKETGLGLMIFRSASEQGDPMPARTGIVLPAEPAGSLRQAGPRVLDGAVGGNKPASANASAKTMSRAVAFPEATVHETAWVDEGARIGAGTRVWHFSHILPGARIGENCVIGQNVMVGAGVTVGNRCKIQNNVSVYEGVTLEDEVFCGPSCVFTNVINPRAAIERKSEFRPTRVGRGASIGANATIVCGHAVGDYSFIAAGAVVTSDVPPFALMAGVPARRIGWVSHAGERLGPELICPRTGQRYRETGTDRLEEIAS